MHDHAPSGIRGTGNRRLLAISLAITATVMVVQVVGAVLSGSLALFADAVHMFTDAAALVIALIASVVAARPANDRRTFGYQRAEVFGALINAVILIVLSVWVAVEGVTRLIDPGEAELAGGLMLVVAIVGLVANAVALWLLSAAQRHSINVRGAYLEVLGDALGSVAVVVAAVVISTTGWTPADTVASLVVGALVLPRAWQLLREALDVLLEAAPRGVDLDRVREHMKGVDGVLDVHDLHAWTITSGMPVLSAHVVVTDEALEAGHGGRILDALCSCLGSHFDVDHCTFQLEGEHHADHEAPVHD
jgi:cobalt-zinc-cadmium efflux system protein